MKVVHLGTNKVHFGEFFLVSLLSDTKFWGLAAKMTNNLIFFAFSTYFALFWGVTWGAGVAGGAQRAPKDGEKFAVITLFWHKIMLQSSPEHIFDTLWDLYVHF